jgi:uncharacterized protein (TIGR02453 family)
MAMAFKGWPASAIEFYEGLEADNSKGYWVEHKAVYERDVKAPMTALLAELAEEFGDSKLFRPNRDVRFSADKSPYKTAVAATIGEGYVSFSADGLMAAAGMYMMASDQLERYRAAVAADRTGAALESVVAGLTKAKVEVHAFDALKTAPKGYPKDHPRIELLRYKGLIAMKTWPPAPWMGTAAAKKRVVDLFHTAQPLVDWLSDHVGPSELASGSGRGR